MQQLMPMVVLSFRKYFLYISFCLVNISILQSQSINTGDWRLIATQAYDSEAETDLTNALTSGTDYFSTTPLNSSSSRTLSVELPVMSNDGMMTFNLLYTGNDASIDPTDYDYSITSITIEAYGSDDSTDGIDGTWTLISNVSLTGYLNDLQKVDIPQASGGEWLRVVFTNNEAVDVDLTELAMYEFHTTGNNNYFLLVGASIMERSGGQSDFVDQVEAFFGAGHGYDPVVFNWAVSGTRIAQLESSMDDYLASHPQAAFVLIHSGGNNVTSTRPLEQTDLSTELIAVNIVAKMESIVQKVISAGKIPILSRLTFRDYQSSPQVEAGLNQSYGSLPYNWLLDDIIEQYTPEYFDPISERGYIDFYELTLNDQSIITGDGIHPDDGQGYKIINYWVKTAFKYLYTGVHNEAILYTETIPNLTDSVSTLIDIAEATMDVSDIWNARLIADQIADHTDRITALNESSLPVTLLDFTYELAQDKTVLKWSTSSEINNDYFSIEKSYDNVNWILMTESIKGKLESNELATYEFYDFDQITRSCYYRLSQTDHDGKHEILKILSVTKNDGEALTLFPNPAAQYFQLSNNQDVQYDQIEMFEISGLKVPLKIVDKKVVLPSLSSGVFLVRIPYHDTVLFRRLMISQ